MQQMGKPLRRQMAASPHLQSQRQFKGVQRVACKQMAHER